MAGNKEHELKKLKMSTVSVESEQEKIRPIQLFPIEIWEYIVDRAGSLERLNLCRANSELDNAFGEGKCRWLFDQILPFLISYFGSTSTILKCRAVCKNWRYAVDQFLEQGHPARRPYNPDDAMEKLLAGRATVDSAMPLEAVRLSPANISKFATFPVHSKSRCSIVIGRALSLQLDGIWAQQSVAEFVTAARTFFESHGHQIWHLQFHQLNRHVSALQFCKTLLEFLILLPNLRSLEIHCDAGASSRETEAQLVSVFRAFPVPILSHLTSMDIEGLPLVFQRYFLESYAAQIEKLAFPIFAVRYMPIQLKEIFLKHSSDIDMLRGLESVTNVPVNCNKLTLDLSRRTGIQEAQLLRVLARFPSLFHLRIILQARCTYTPPGFIPAANIKLPSVRFFEIEGDCRDIFGFGTFLCALPSLQYLHIRDISYFGGYNVSLPVARGTDAAKRASVEIAEYIRRDALDESPIWNTLAGLRLITIRRTIGGNRKHCSREKVEYLRKTRLDLN